MDPYEGSGEYDEVTYDFALRITGTLPCGVQTARSPDFPSKQFIIIPELRSDA